MISSNSAKDLEKVYPDLPKGRTYVTRVGVAEEFKRPSNDDIKRFRTTHGLQDKAYALMVGERLGYGGYKNGALAFSGLSLLPPERSLVLICVGGHSKIEPQLRKLAPRLDVRRVALNDEDLRAAYAGAHALLYPSKYEGFGMPPVECMACGTPAIVCRNSSIPEVVGDAALYVDEDDPADMANAIVKLFDPVLRQQMIERGMKQAAIFSFGKMAQEMEKAFIETHDRIRKGEITVRSNLPPELPDMMRGVQTNDPHLRTTSSEKMPMKKTDPGLTARYWISKVKRKLLSLLTRSANN